MAIIKKLKTKLVQTRNGEAAVWNVFVEDDGQSTWASSFVDDWNADWQEGMEIEIRPEQWRSRMYNDKEYWSIARLTGTSTSAGGHSPYVKKYNQNNPLHGGSTTELKEKVENIEKMVEKIYKAVVQQVEESVKLEENRQPLPPKTTIETNDEMPKSPVPTNYPDIDISDVPF